jgi:hypothetical protein
MGAEADPSLRGDDVVSVIECKAEISKGMERMVEGFAMWYLTNSDPGDEQEDREDNAPCIGCVERCGQCV